MIIKVNTLGIYIDLSGSAQSVIDRFGTPCVTMPVGSVDTIEVITAYDIGASVQIEDSVGDDFYIHHTEITSFNGVTTPFTDVKSVHDAISNAILGF